MGELRAARRPEPLWDLVEESLDEAQFLWRQWEDALSTHARDLAGVSFWIEERLLGAIDGICAAGDAAIEPLLVPALDAEDPFRATAAAYALSVGGEPRGVEALLTLARAADPARLAAVRRAIELSPGDALLGPLELAVGEVGPALAAELWRIRAFRRLEPGPMIAYAVSSAHPGMRAAALTALRHVAPTTPLGQFQHSLERNLGAPEAEVRDAAIETGLILGSAAAWTRCLELARSAAPDGGRALLLAATLGTEREHASLFSALGDEALQRDALFALGFAGTRAAIEACLRAMSDEPLARVAGEAFCAITGLDLERERLVAPPPAGPQEPIPFEDEDLDADLVPKPDDLLPLPDVPGVTRWWAKHGGRFAVGERYVGGRAVALVALHDALETAPMRRRHGVALELAVRTAGRYQVETRAFTAEQRRQLRSFGAGAMPRSPLARYFSPA